MGGRKTTAVGDRKGHISFGEEDCIVDRIIEGGASQNLCRREEVMKGA